MADSVGRPHAFRVALARRMAFGMLALVAVVALASVLALRTILYRQLDETLLHIAEVEARHGAASTSSAFTFHQGVLLQPREREPAPLTRYAELWTRAGRPLLRSRNLHADLVLPPAALAAARRGDVGWGTARWQGQQLRSVVYPLEFVGAMHGGHLLQVAAATDVVDRTLREFGVLLVLLSLAATAGAFGVGHRLAGAALRPTAEITAQAEAIEAGTLSARITAHADVQEFSRLVTVLNGMLDRLDDAFQAQHRFTADASHELRAPLNVLRGDIEVALRRERTPAEYRETLERCRDEVILMSRLAADLLVLARSDAGVLVENEVEVDLRDLAERLGRRYEALASERGVTVQVAGDEGITTGDPAVLQRIVGNLLDNAVKHSPRGGIVTIDVRRRECRETAERTGTGGGDPDAIVLTVSDEGPGVAPAVVSRLFTRFVRADPSRERGDGVGLGLAIARAGAEAHGGTLKYIGGEGGAVFEVALPAVRAGPADGSPGWRGRRSRPLVELRETS